MKLNQLLRPLTRRTKRQLMASASRALSQSQPQSMPFEPLEKRQMMSFSPGLTINIQTTTGGKTVNVTSATQVVTLDIVATVTGTKAGGNQGLDSVCGSVLSTLTDGNYSVGGDLENCSPTDEFYANGAQEANSVDLNGDGYLDAGSNDNSDIAGFFNSRAGGIVYNGTVSGDSNSFLVGTLTYNVDTLAYGQATDINFRLRNGLSAGAFDAVWEQDGIGDNDSNGTIIIGAPVVITDSALTPPPDGSIAGTVHGTSLGASSTLSGVTLFMNTDGNSSYEAGDTTVTTNSSGQYDFTGMHAGTYYVGEELPSGYVLSSPSTQPTKIVLTTSQNLSGQDFIDAATGSISGTITQSLNGNSSNLGGVTVNISSGGQHASTTTSTNGTYSFTGLAAGTYDLSEVVPTGDTQTSPASSPAVVTLTAGQAGTQNFTDTVTTGSISGTVTKVVSGSSSNFGGVEVYIDTNDVGSLQSGDPTATTNSSGQYSFTGLTAGTYYVREVVPSGYTQTAGGSPITVILTAGENATGENFTDTSTTVATASISGTVTQDVNGSTTDESGVTLYMDLNDTGSLASGDPTVITNSSGYYDFTGLAANTYLLREVVPTGYKQTSPANTPELLTVSAGQNITGENFTNTGTAVVATGSIAGTVSKVVSGVTSGDSGVTVYLDLNDSGSFASGDPTSTTSSTGTYSFTGLAAGTYYLRQEVPGGYTQTSPSSSPTKITLTAGQAATGENFTDTANTVVSTGSIAGIVSKVVSGVTSADSGVTVYLDLNNSGSFVSGDPTATTSSTGAYSFTALAAGTYYVAEEVPSGYTQTSPSGTSTKVTLTSGQAATGENFTLTANSVTSNASIAGTVSKVISGVTTADSGVTVYLDLKDSGSLASGDPTAVTSSTGTYSFTSLTAGTYYLREVVPANFSQTSPGSSPTKITLTSGQSVTGENFTDTATYTPGSIAGTVYIDKNSNGKLDSGETGIAGVEMYIDLNLDGTIDSGDPTTMTSSTGAYSFTGLAPATYRVREVVPTGDKLTNPTVGYFGVTVQSNWQITGENWGNTVPTTSTASISGTVFKVVNGVSSTDSGVTVYLDTNNNGTLDSGESSTVTSSTGTYSFTNLAAGTYNLREVVPSGFTQTTPSSSPTTITLTTGQAVAGENFTDTAATVTPGSISGEVFSDVNGTGNLVSPDLGIPGVTVYLDLKNDGKDDSGDPTTTTSSTGTYSFTGLTPGTYVIRAVPLSGDSFTAATNRTVTVASGASVTGENFGVTGALSLPGSIINASTNAGLGSWVVYCDLKDTGSFVSSDNNKTTLSNGTFDFVSLKAGTYILRVIPQAGFTLTSPASGYYTVVLQPGLPVTGIVFSETPTAGTATGIGTANGAITLSGTVFEDLAGTGVQTANDPGLAGWVVYCDLQGTGSFVSSDNNKTTESNGSFEFVSLKAGTYTIRVIPQADYTETLPNDGFYTVTLAPGDPVSIAFGEQLT